jgi:hypothetical protein
MDEEEKETRLEKSASYFIAFCALLLAFSVALTLIMLMPKIFFIMGAVYSVFVISVFYILAKNKQELKSGAYDGLIYHDGEDMEKYLK